MKPEFQRFNPAEVAVCTIHGNNQQYGGDIADRFAWPKLQISQLRKHTPSGYKVFAYGNEIVRSHQDFLQSCPEVEFIDGSQIRHGQMTHVWPIRNWLTRRALKSGFKWLVHLDSDAFPVKDGWLEDYCSRINEQCPVVAVQRLENNDTHSDRSLLIFSSDGFRQHAFDFSSIDTSDAGGNISSYLEAEQLDWVKLNRTNVHDYHRLISAIYDDAIYHHGAGSREPIFRFNFHDITKADQLNQNFVHDVLRERIFERTELFLSELRGTSPPFNLQQAIGERNHQHNAIGLKASPLSRIKCKVQTWINS